MYEIRPPRTEAELQAGTELIRTVFEQSFGTYPRETSHHLFIAVDQVGRVVGTLNLQSYETDVQFEVERFFHCTQHDLYAGAPEQIGEFGRFTAIVPGISNFLSGALVLFANQLDIRFLVSFNKLALARLLRRAHGVEFDIRDFKVRSEEIPVEYRPYFLDPDDPVVVLSKPMEALLPRARQILSETNGEVNVYFK